MGHNGPIIILKAVYTIFTYITYNTYIAKCIHTVSTIFIKVKYTHMFCLCTYLHLCIFHIAMI